MKRRRYKEPWSWHEAMMAEGPTGFIRRRGADTWEKLHEMCRLMMADWERRSERERLAYAFRNPEDRR